jgi:hypothetical protein
LVPNRECDDRHPHRFGIVFSLDFTNSDDERLAFDAMKFLTQRRNGPAEAVVAGL